MTNFPQILVTTTRGYVPLHHSSQQCITYVTSPVIDILVNLGCIPVLLPNAVHPDRVDDIIRSVDGVVLTSGQDICPKIDAGMLENGKESNVNGSFQNSKVAAPLDRGRDFLEIAVYKSAVMNNRPILGVCRGMQIMNVAEGGTLYQQLPRDGIVIHEIETDGWINYHSINICDNSLLSSLLNTKSVFISSIHHQGIAELGAGLKVSAYSDDGLIEAVEGTGEGFVLGLQGHFEKGLKNQPALNNIWRAFVKSAMTGGYRVE